MDHLSGQRAVVMGGSSGIGLETAKLLSSLGAAVFITGRNANKLAVAADGTQLMYETSDATSPGDLRRFYELAGPFDHLILALTSGKGGGPFRSLDLDELRRGFDGKFWAHMQAAQLALGTLRPNGSITFISAISARRANPNTAGLAAINGAIEATVRVLAAELRPIRINAVSPGVIETDWWNRMPRDQRDATFEKAAASSAVGRIGSAEEVAEAVALVVRNRFMTGVVVECDGGLGLI